MGRHGYALIYLFMFVFLIITFIRCLRNKEKEYARPLSVVILIAAICNLIYSLGLCATKEIYFAITTSLWGALLPWLFFSFYIYMKHYLNISHNKLLFKVLVALVLIDSILMLTNISTNWIMEFKRVTVPSDYSALISGTYFIMDNKWYYYVHIIMCYSLVIPTIYYTIRQWIITARIYRVKYMSLTICMFVAIIINISFIVLKQFYIDLSALMYGLISYYALLFTVNFTPKILISKLTKIIVNNMQDGLVVFDSNGEFFHSNVKMSEIFVSFSKRNTYYDFKTKYCNVPLDNIPHMFEMVSNGKRYYYKVTHTTFVDKQNKIEAYYYIFHDVTFEMETVKEREYTLHHDNLTGVYSRAYFLEEAKTFVKEDKEYYLLVTNFEQFRLYNELYGAEAGDDLLRKMAKVLYDMGLKYNILYARMESDHFAICLEKELYNQLGFANVLIDKFKKYENNQVILKIGICPLDEVNVISAYDRAIFTIHHFKDNIEQRYGFYSSSIKSKVVRENLLMTEFDKSIQNKYFTIYLQPQINYRNGKLIGAEALVRWIHPELGMISPFEFITIFEKSKYISRLDLYVWEEACKYLDKCNKSGYNNLSLSVNISRMDFYNMDVFEELKFLVEKYEISPSQLKLEITESAFMSNYSKIVTVIMKLREFGFLIEMDDFGSGYSSLNTLREIPIDIIKLDMKFLSKGNYTPKSIEILDSTISMAHRLQLPVIAEGVETYEQAEMLSRMNCELIQGYYHAKPMPISDFDVYLSKATISTYLLEWLETDEARKLYSMFKEVDKYYGLSALPTMILSPVLDQNGNLIDLNVLYQNQAFSDKDALKFGDAVNKSIRTLFRDFDDHWRNFYNNVLKTRKCDEMCHVMPDGQYIKLKCHPLGNTKYLVAVAIES